MKKLYEEDLERIKDIFWDRLFKLNDFLNSPHYLQTDDEHKKYCVVHIAIDDNLYISQLNQEIYLEFFGDGFELKKFLFRSNTPPNSEPERDVVVEKLIKFIEDINGRNYTVVCGRKNGWRFYEDGNFGDLYPRSFMGGTIDAFKATDDGDFVLNIRNYKAKNALIMSIYDKEVTFVHNESDGLFKAADPAAMNTLARMCDRDKKISFSLREETD